MTQRAQELLTQIFQLSLPERQELVVELLVRLDGTPEPGAQEAWAQEIRRRLARIRSGESTGVPWKEAQRQIEQALRRS